MRFEAIHALSGAYAVDGLDDDERAAFEAHLERCGECQDEVRSLQEAAAMMSLPTEVAPPPELRDAVLGASAGIRPLPPQTRRERAAVADAGSEPGPRGGVVLPFRRRVRDLGTRSRVAVAAVAAAVVAVVGIGLSTQPWAPDDSGTTYTVAERVIDAPDAEAVTQRFPDGSSATVTRSVAEGRAVLETRDMPEPPADRVFELWLMDEEGNPTPAGLMATAGDTTVVLDGDARDAAAVGITVEPKGGSDQPTTEPIAMFDLGEAEA